MVFPMIFLEITTHFCNHGGKIHGRKPLARGHGGVRPTAAELSSGESHGAREARRTGDGEGSISVVMIHDDSYIYR